MEGPEISKKHTLYATATADSKSNELLIKIVNGTAQSATVALDVQGMTPGAHATTLIQLTSSKASNANSFAAPCFVQPATSHLSLKVPGACVEVPAYSFSIYRIKRASSKAK